MESNFANLIPDILKNIAAPFSLRDLHAASLVCKSWWDILHPLRESVEPVWFGRVLKKGGPGVKPKIEKALEYFLKGANYGSTVAMVEAGLVYWEMGENELAGFQFRRAAEVGDAVGQCNLGFYYLTVQPINTREAMKWYKQSAENGCIQAQYNLAFCLDAGLKVNTNMGKAGEWYLKAAEGGCVPAMYEISLCYSLGSKGVRKNETEARKWMKKAADHDLAERGGEKTEANNWRPRCCSYSAYSSKLSYFRM